MSEAEGEDAAAATIGSLGIGSLGKLGEPERS